MIPAFRKIQTSQKDVDQLQTNVSQQFAAIKGCQLVDGAAITVTLAVGSNVVNNPLQRTPLGWIITDKLGVGDIYRTAWDSRTITLVSSTAVTISLWTY